MITIVKYSSLKLVTIIIMSEGDDDDNLDKDAHRITNNANADERETGDGDDGSKKFPIYGARRRPLNYSGNWSDRRGIISIGFVPKVFIRALLWIAPTT